MRPQSIVINRSRSACIRRQDTRHAAEAVRARVGARMELGSSTEYAPFVEERVEDGSRHRRSLWLPVLLVAGCLVAFDLITPSFTSERRTWRRQWLEQWVQLDGYSPCGPATLLLNVAVHDTVRNSRDPGVYEWLPQATRDPRAGETASLV